MTNKDALKEQLKEHYDEGFDDIKAEAIASFEHWASLVTPDTLYSHSRISALLYLALTEERPQGGEWIEFKSGYYKCDKCGEVERAKKISVQSAVLRCELKEATNDR